MNENNDFLRSVVKKDLKNGKYKSVHTRFPPEPNGFPHIGHAKSICINFGIAKDFGGLCNLRMDDTNPTTEDTKYVEALKDAVTWLGFTWHGDVRYSSDYFEELYQYAIKLIKMGKAYVDSLSEEEIKEYRGTITSPGKRSKYASRSVEENLKLFEEMKNGKYENGHCVLRAKIDMSAANMKMRDPLLYRIRHSSHFRTQDKWCIYPMYDYAHCLSDYIEGISHSICTLEFENNREIYDWILDNLNLTPPRPYQHEFARLNINYTVMSKRKLLQLVNEKKVSGWDDPRLPTIAGLKRRGYTPQSIINFCDTIGIAKANSIVDISQLEFCIRDDLNQKAPRYMAVLNPLKVVLENLHEDETIEADLYPKDVQQSRSRKVPLSKVIYIEKDDFSLNPPKGYFRLTLKQAVRLKHAYIIEAKEIIKDKNGEVCEIKAKIFKNSKSGNDTSGIKVKSAIQWVSEKYAKKAEVRIYDRLFLCENPQSLDDLNPNSLKIIKNAFIEPAIVGEKDDRFQFERHGYFCRDYDYKDENLVFNKIVSLKDSWNKKSKKNTQKDDKVIIHGEVSPMNEKQMKIFENLKGLKLNEEVANILARDELLANFFYEALNCTKNPNTLANLVANDISNQIKNQHHIKFSPLQVAKLANMIDEEIISSKIAKDVLNEMIINGDDPQDIVDKKGLKQISDKKIILSFIDEVLKENKKNIQKFKNGNENLLGFFVGQVLKKSNGKANPKIVQELIKNELKK